MLEESKMDKKVITRSLQPQSRASAIDCKKGSESTAKPLPRHNKKREVPGNSSKYDPSRKNVPPSRGRGQADRRPRPRGAPGFNMGRTEITGLADDEPEIGSVFVPGSKKQNLNHLLNFMYTPRGGNERRGNTPQRKNYTQRTHPHNHELYLQACCQFVVKEDGDYKANLMDPDVPVKWDLIEEIVVRNSSPTECPICLGAAVAGRVGRCGHVQCWACALHYADHHAAVLPRCPVCAAPLKVQDMKPARTLRWDASSTEITMRLVRRLRGSTMVEVAPARGQITELSEAKVLPLAQINDARYAKLFAANKQQVLEILERERREILEQIPLEIDTTEVQYFEQALEMLKMKEDMLKNETQSINVSKEEIDESPIVYETHTVNKQKIDWFDEDEGAACMETINEQIADMNINENKSTLNPDAPEFDLADVIENQSEEFPLIDYAAPEAADDEKSVTDIDKDNQAKYFYFYQAEDGQQVFLNSLNVRLLNASWGVLAAAPLVIHGRVLHREQVSLVEQTRKHMPFAAHLPLYCPFEIVELDLQPPYVTPEALQSYSDELDRRARFRAKQEREERRRERAYHRAMEGPPKPDITSPLLFPPTSPPSIDSFQSYIASSDHSQNYTAPSVDPSLPDNAAGPSPGSGSGLSFAKMASTGGAWRVRAPRPASPPPAATDADSASAPRTINLSDAIEAALLAPHSSSGKKNKKNKLKHRLLLATGVQHST